MLILRDNKVINLDTSEDTLKDLIIVKSLEELQRECNFHGHVQDCVGTIKWKYPDHGEVPYYYGMRTQSEFSDGEGMDSGLVGAAPTKGEFIYNAWKYHYRVFTKQGGRWIELTKEGPKELLPDVKLYYTRPAVAQTEEEVAAEENAIHFNNERADH